MSTAEPTPPSQFKRRAPHPWRFRSGWALLAFVVPCLSCLPQPKSSLPRQVQPPGVELVVEAWECYEEEDGVVVAQGSVTNVSSADILGTRAHVRFYAKDRSLLAQGEAEIEASPLWPEQTSSFELVIPITDAMESTSVVFSSGDGRRLHTMSRAKYESRRGEWRGDDESSRETESGRLNPGD